jgi:guanosine-3',5'-bis(diphosphate) 3'-pyrophosphohydrolase
VTGYVPAEIPASLATVLASCMPEDASRIVTAFQFAAAAHAGQHRDEGTPFIDHPVGVLLILWHELGCRDIDVLLAALTHDVLEDCDTIDATVLEGVIGPRASSMVRDVTKRSVPDVDKPARDLEYLESLPRLQLESRLLKLSDRIHNLRSVLLADDRAKAFRYLQVSRDEFYPLALVTDTTAARLVNEACDAIQTYLEAESR